MVDGANSSTLAISERLQRLREYSSRFRAGNFNYEDLAAHPHYVHQIHSLPQYTKRIADTFFSKLYSENDRCGVALSVFTPGSVQAGVRSSRSLLHIGTPGTEGLPVIVQWAIDEVQDLLVMADRDDTSLIERLDRRFVSRSESVALCDCMSHDSSGGTSFVFAFTRYTTRRLPD